MSRWPFVLLAAMAGYLGGMVTILLITAAVERRAGR